MNNDFVFKKRFGQNFLSDQNVINKIIQAIGPRDNQHIIEIGPGQGALTRHLIEYSKILHSIEIDREIIKELQQVFVDADNFNLINSDALKINFIDIEANPFRIVGNLPYNISTPILFHCLKFIKNTIDCTFMLQREVATRICAKPDTSQYGRLTIMIQYHYITDHLFDISPYSFTPAPKVYSSLIRLTPNIKKEIIAIDEAKFAIIVRDAFTMRRKTLKNALKIHLKSDTLEKCNISPMSRPENLSVSDFVNISNNL